MERLKKGLYNKPPPHRAMEAQEAQTKQRERVGLGVPPLEEENPRVKCRECGAFGHTDRSGSCPIKYWDGGMAPRPLGPKKNKENQHPYKRESVLKPVPMSQTERQKEQRQGQEEQQRKASLHDFPMQLEGREQQSRVKHTSRLVWIHTQQRRPVPDSATSKMPRVKMSDQRPMCAAVVPRQSLDAKSVSISEEHKGQNLDAVHGIPKPDLRPCGKNPDLKTLMEKDAGNHHMNIYPESSKIHGMVQFLDPPSPTPSPDVKTQPRLHRASVSRGQVEKHCVWTPGKRPTLVWTNSHQNPTKKHRTCSLKPQKDTTGNPTLKALQDVKSHSQVLLGNSSIVEKVPSSVQELPHSRDLYSAQPCIVSRPPSFHPGPRQPIRMVFTRAGNGCWSSRFVPVSSVQSSEEKTPPAKCPSFLQKTKSVCPEVPWSVLYEDLQVSSSEESGQE